MIATDHAAALRQQLTDARGIVAALGLEAGAKRQPGGLTIRCPAHDERTASCSVTAGPDSTLRVHCFGCGLGGDALTLIAAVHRLDQVRDFRRVLKLAAAIAGYDLGAPVSRMPVPVRPAAPPRPRIPHAELEQLWAASHQVNRTLDDVHALDTSAAFYLARRGWWPPTLAALDLVRITPLPNAYAWPSWWPRSWATDWRIITRAYTAAGELASVHARSITPGVEPKTRWPYGYPAGYLFADARGAALMRGELADTDKLVIVEGMTDLVAMALAIADGGRKHGVIGVTSGSTKALAAVQWPARIPVVVFVDGDDAGERYAAEIMTALPRGLDVRRARASVAQKAVR